MPSVKHTSTMRSRANTIVEAGRHEVGGMASNRLYGEKQIRRLLIGVQQEAVKDERKRVVSLLSDAIVDAPFSDDGAAIIDVLDQVRSKVEQGEDA